MSETVKQYFSGVVKQVLDGGLVVIRGQPRNGPPPERTLALTEIDVPRMARRPGTSNPSGSEDDAWGWESREYLRQLLVGKQILGTVTHSTNNRDYGHVLFGSTDPEKAENVAAKLVTEGFAKVRDNCNDAALKEAQEGAKNAGKGIWSSEPASAHIRKVLWDYENPRQLVDRMAGKPIKTIIEGVRDGTTVRAFIPVDDSHVHITMLLSGVRAPAVKYGNEGKIDASQCEPYGLEAHYFIESRLLQREVEIVLESVNNKNLVGTVLHPMGNIAEALLKEGLAKVVDWSLACVSSGPEKYRQAQASAKEKRLRLWKDFQSSGPEIAPKDREFTGKVLEVVLGDCIVVKKSKTEIKKIYLASIRPPRLPENRPDRPKTGTFRPLYDIPFMFEAREFLRKKLIGQSVQVTVDYIQQANEEFPEKTCCTVTIGGINIAEAIVAKGLATVVRYSADNDRRSSQYDLLLAAEDKAIKSTKGMHDKKNIPTRRIADITGDVTKSKQFLPFLQRAGRMQAVVEFVASGSRFRLYIPRETCVITFLLSGINCPRGARTMPSGTQVEAEPYGDEAAVFVKELVLQREVEIEVEAMDKGGNFIGWLFCDTTNVSLSLVEEGFAAAFVGNTGDKSNYGRLILQAEETAKRKKLRRWANFVEEVVTAAEAEEEDTKENDAERKVSYEKVLVTEVTNDGKFFAQHVDEGPKLEQLMKQIREEFVASPPLAGVYQPKKGDLCAAKYVDNEWYRAKVEKVTGGDVSVLYVDYGNRATLSKAKCAALPGAFTGLPPYAKEYSLALCALANDEEYASQGIQAMKDDLLDRQFKMNVEYRVGGSAYVTLVDVDNTANDAGKALVADGLLMAERKGGRRLAKLVSAYQEAMDSAKKAHLNIWEYGDITADDAREFGVGKK